MPSSSTYISIAVAVVALSCMFAIAYLQGLRDEKSIVASPSIPAHEAVMTNFASTRIHATADEVFATVLNYKDYSWSSNTRYIWPKTGADGIPLVGSTGTLELRIDGFADRDVSLKLTVLDQKRKMVAERSTQYYPWLMNAERVQEVVPIEGHPNLCEYRTWMTHQGIVAPLLILFAKEELEDAQKHIATDLRMFVESRKRQNTGAARHTNAMPTTK